MARVIALVVIVLLLSSCGPSRKQLPTVQEGRELVVVTYNGPSTYFVNGNDAFAGLEYDLVNLFVQELGPDIKVKFLVVGGVDEVIPALLKGKAHVAAAALGMTRLRSHLVRFGPSYQQVQPQVVVNKERGLNIRKVSDLIGKKLEVTTGSSYAERLAALSAQFPGLRWQEIRGAGADELLEKVADGRLDATIADSQVVSVMQNYYPNLEVAFDFGLPENLAWGFPKTGEEWVYQKARRFFERIRKDGTLHRLIDRYYGHAERLNAMDVTTFLIRSRTVLPQYVKLFKQAQETTGIDWRLLAAVSYQESHWNTYSTSPTNVRGLMMLTEDTADRLGVTDRLDPQQSIPAGARYILQLKDGIPARISEPDRTWLALAAYNIGLAHLEDARILAQRMGLNPDAWADVKKTLPLLNKAEYYSTLKYGFARGGAAVIFVESVRTYYSILEKYEKKHTPALPEFNVAWLYTGRITATQ
ncbi:MAG: membrane-bound lytic murein transglycosylase MltF [Methylophilaceae bacterium]|nr:membrane-bound lytic murein transglycosylase MltF [Methylophilaceae bacterium]